jgi:hypothetical protein
MTTLADRPDLTPSTGERPDSDALIKEARQLRRRRYLIIGVVLLVVVGGSTVGLAMSHGGGRRNAGSGHSQTVPAEPKAIPPTSATRFPEATLPSSALFTQISVTSREPLFRPSSHLRQVFRQPSGGGLDQGTPRRGGR